MASADRTPSRPAADAISEFFDELAGRGHEPLLERVTGTLRFDVDDGGTIEHWYVSVRRGAVEVSHQDAAADSVIRLDADSLRGMVTGTMNAQAALLRGVGQAQGDIGLLVRFQRLFPGPPGSQAGTPVRTAVAEKRSS